MAQETKVGLLVGLALILLVGLVLSDLFTKDDPKVDPANSPTQFSQGVQDDIYRQPPAPPVSAGGHRELAGARFAAECSSESIRQHVKPDGPGPGCTGRRCSALSPADDAADADRDADGQPGPAAPVSRCCRTWTRSMPSGPPTR